LHSGETPSAEEATDGLESLNEMLGSWIHDGIDLEFVTITSLNTVLPYPPDHESSFRYNLAIQMCPDYGIAVTPAIAELAMQGYRRMQREYLSNPELGTDSALLPAYNPNGLNP
jgi:hypothetical protein